MSDTIRLTCAQALVRYLAALQARDADEETSYPLFAGVFAIFGHGNVAGWARRCTTFATNCPRTARTTSRRWHTRPSPMRRRACAAG